MAINQRIEKGFRMRRLFFVLFAKGGIGKKGCFFANPPTMYAFNAKKTPENQIFFGKVLTKCKCRDMIKEKKGGFHL